MYSENFVSKKLKDFAQKNEWLISGEYIYGEEQGFLFSGLDGKGQKTFITPVPGITDEQKEELFVTLEKNKETMKLLEYAISDDFLCIRIKESMQLKTDDIEFILALLVGTMQELFIEPVGRCQECGKTGAENESFIYDLYCYMHDDCEKKHEDLVLEEISDSSNFSDSSDSSDASDESDDSVDHEALANINDDEDMQNLKVKPIKKFLFTIGGAILGSIPWLILPFVMDLIKDLLSKITENSLIFNFTQSLLTCVCAYLVSYFAIIGYRLSKSKMETKGRWIVGIVSIVTVIVIQFVSLAILIIKEPSVTLTFSNYITNLSKSNFYINILLGALIGIVFTLIAVLPFFDNSVSSAKAKNDFIARNKRSTIAKTQHNNQDTVNDNENDSIDKNVIDTENDSENNDDQTPNSDSTDNQ